METAIKQLLDGGADVAVEIAASSVATAAWTVMKCRYGCPQYGRNLCCPPFAPSWREMDDILACYRRAILFRVHDMSAGTPLAIEVTAGLFRRGYYKALAFGTGPCRRCKVCKGKPGECPEPHATAPSMEACGVDVFATVRANGIEVSTYAAPGAVPDCFGLILVD